MVELSAKIAKEKGWILIQDTTWEGYIEIPSLIMDGYMLMMAEIDEQMKTSLITHVILQVGVGSFASSIVRYIREQYNPNVFIITIESEVCACLWESFLIRENKAVEVNENTLFVSLDCGKLSDLAWPILRDNVNATVKVSDKIAPAGVKFLHAKGISAGESGAAIGLGFLISLDDKSKTALKINEHSRVLLFNTEGMTTPEITEGLLK